MFVDFSTTEVEINAETLDWLDQYFSRRQLLLIFFQEINKNMEVDLYNYILGRSLNFDFEEA